MPRDLFTYRLTHWLNEEGNLRSVLEPLKKYGEEFKIKRNDEGKWAVFVREKNKKLTRTCDCDETCNIDSHSSLVCEYPCYYNELIDENIHANISPDELETPSIEDY